MNQLLKETWFKSSEIHNWLYIHDSLKHTSGLVPVFLNRSQVSLLTFLPDKGFTMSTLSLKVTLIER